MAAKKQRRHMNPKNIEVRKPGVTLYKIYDHISVIPYNKIKQMLLPFLKVNVKNVSENLSSFRFNYVVHS